MLQLEFESSSRREFRANLPPGHELLDFFFFFIQKTKMFIFIVTKINVNSNLLQARNFLSCF